MSRAPRPKTRMTVMLIAVGVVLAAVFGWGALRSYMIGKFLAGFGNQVQTVATMTASTTPWQASLSSVGSLTAVNGANLSAQLAGIVDSIHFKSGEDVAAGTLLATLRPDNDPAVLAQLQAQASLDEITYERDRKQFAADAISRAQVDTDRANLAVAQAQVRGQAALMAEKQVRAPFAGRLGIRQVNIGQYLAVGTQIVSLQQLNPLYVDFYLPEQSLNALQTGQKVQVGVDAYPGRTFTATISAVDAQVSSTTRSIQVRATLPNDKLALRPGMFATVNIAAGAPQNFITLPQTAIGYNSYGDTVFIVRHGKDQNGKPDLLADQVFVTLGDTRGDQVAILKGVKPGEVVVTAGQLKLHNGSLVRINNSLQPSDSPNPNPPNE